MHYRETCAFRSILDYAKAPLLGSGVLWRFEPQRCSWWQRELVAEAEASAAVLADLGIGRGDRVALLMGNGPDLIIALLALWLRGAVPVPLPLPGGGDADWAGYLATVDAIADLRGLIHDRGAAASAIGQWARRARKPAWTARCISAADADERLPALPLDAGDMALLQLRSGSIGVPKLVVITHGMLMHQLRLLVELFAGHTGHLPASWASWLPAGHNAGLLFGVLLPLALGADSLLATPDFYAGGPARWFRLLARLGVEIAFATNSSAAALSRCPPPEPTGGGATDLSALHLVFGAEKVHPRVLRRFEADLASHGLRPEHVHVVYGMTENVLSASATPPGRPRRLSVAFRCDDTVHLAPPAATAGAVELVSVGRALPGCELQVRGADGRPLPERRLGDIWLRGPCLSPGYFRDAAATARRFRGGWLDTGDRGFLLNGELYFVSRADDVVGIGAADLVPDEVEQALEEQVAAVRAGASCLLAVPAAGGKNAAVLLVELHLPRARRDRHWLLRLRRLLEQCFALGDAKVLVVPRGSVLRTSSGRKARRRMAARLLAGRLTARSAEAVAAELNRREPAL
jgi:fatty-acyl-CoA synthase